MWSPTGRLILCNERYVQMYNLSPELTRAGRFAARSDRPPHQGRKLLRQPRPVHRRPAHQHRQGQDVSHVREHEGRFISISNRPMGDGGWVATHEDITEQRMAELQRSSMKELESRRAVIEDAIAGFRERVESVLKSVSDAAKPCSRPPSGCWARRSRPRSARESAVKASSEASANVATAATAAPSCRPRSPRSAISSAARPRWCASRSTRPKPPTNRSRASPPPRRRSATW